MTGARELAQAAITMLENAREPVPGYDAGAARRSAVGRVARLARIAREPDRYGRSDPTLPAVPDSFDTRNLAGRILDMLPPSINARSWTVADVAGLIARIREAAGLPADGAAPQRAGL